MVVARFAPSLGGRDPDLCGALRAALWHARNPGGRAGYASSAGANSEVRVTRACSTLCPVPVLCLC